MERFDQVLVHSSGAVQVTLLREPGMRSPMVIAGGTVLEAGAPIVWFTFPGAWHDVGRFHLSDGTFTGIYGNIIEPVRIGDDAVWEITDLFLDIWYPPGGEPLLLDEAELLEAEGEGWIDSRTAHAARSEARRLMRAAAAGTWPPPVVGAWSLERALAAADRSEGGR